MKQPKEAQTAPLDPSPPDSAIQLLYRLLQVSEQILNLAQTDLHGQAQALQQLMLERGELLETTRRLNLQALPESDQQAALPLVEQLTRVDKALGEALQGAMQLVQIQLGTCKHSRQVLTQYRHHLSDDTSSTQSRQA